MAFGQEPNQKAMDVVDLMDVVDMRLIHGKPGQVTRMARIFCVSITRLLNYQIF